MKVKLLWVREGMPKSEGKHKKTKQKPLKKKRTSIPLDMHSINLTITP